MLDLAGNSEGIFNSSSIFGFLAISLAAINIFGGIFSYPENACDVQKKEERQIMISANLSAVFYLISGVLFILALRGLSSPETSRQGNFFGILGMVIAITVTFLSIRKFFKWIYLCINFSFDRRINWSIHSL